MAVDKYKAKLCCSLRWIAGILRESTPYKNFISILCNPYNEDDKGLNYQVVSILTDPSLYVAVVAVILPKEDTQRGDFSSLLHCMARHGVYVLEDGGKAVNDSVLAQSSPFREASHLAIMDGLMTLYTKTNVSVQQVVKTVKRISTFMASKDLPYGVNDSLVLWLNKVSQAVVQAEIRQREDLVHVSDARQRRRNKLQLLGAGEPHICLVEDVCVGVGEGQCLGALLVHYVPQSFKWKDFHFSQQPLSRQQAEENISKVIEFSKTHLPTPGFNIDKETLLNSKETPSFEPNILSLLAQLYLCFETRGVCVVNEKAGTTSSNEASNSQLCSKDPKSPDSVKHGLTSGSDQVFQRRSTTSSITVQSQSQHSLHENTSPKAVPGTRLARDLKRNKTIQQLSSHSESALTSCNQRPLTRGDPIISTPNTGTSTAVTNVSVFKPPVRDAVTRKQAAALASFTAQNLKPTLHKLTHAQSSPSIHHSPAPDKAPFRTVSSQDLISASTDELHLREQMLAGGQQCRVSITRGKKGSQQLAPHSNSSSNSNSTTDLHTTSTSRVADVSANCTESWGTMKEHPNVLDRVKPPANRSSREKDVGSDTAIPRPNKEPLQMLQNPSCDKGPQIPENPLPMPVKELLKCSPILPEELEAVHYYLEYGEENGEVTKDAEMRRSYTIDKQHTFASASAAGLPIVNSDDQHNTDNIANSVQIEYSESAYRPVHRTMGISHVSQEDVTYNRSSSGSSSSSGPSVVHLNVFPTNYFKHPPTDRNAIPTNVPPMVQELIEKGQAKSMEILARQAMRKKCEQSMREKVRLIELREQKDNLTIPPKDRSSLSTDIPAVTESSDIQKLATVDNVHRDAPLSSVNVLPSTLKANTDQSKHIVTQPTSQRQELKTNCDEKGDNQQATPPIIPVPCNNTAKKVQQRTLVPGSLSELNFPFSPIISSEPIDHFMSEPDYVPTFQPVGTFAQAPPLDLAIPNPWSQTPKAASQLKEVDVLRRREQQVKTKLKEREKARKTALEHRRKSQANTRALHELNHLEATASEPVSKLQLGEESSDVTKVIRYQLSSQQQYPTAEEERGQASSTDLPTLGRQSDYLSHNGPGCYVRPQTKSNKKLIKNALCYVCLAGQANLPLKQRALAELESTLAHHVLILFRDIIGFKFRGLYSYSTSGDQVTKIFGNGPKTIKAHMVSHLYKYNSGLKEFKEIPSITFSISVDALTIQNEYWNSRKSKPPTGAHQ